VKSYADHFSGLAKAYASSRPGYPDELFTYLAELAPSRELAWDCAAGSGQATIPLARRFNRVVATDVSPAMLSQAPRHPGVEYRAAPAEASGLADASVDLVTVAQALHWLDTTAFYAEVKRVLVSAGLLAVWSYGAPELTPPDAGRVLHRFYAETVGPYWPPERRHVESGYRTLPFPFMELASPRLEMVEHWNLAQLLGYVRTWSATQRFHDAVGRDPAEQLGQDLAPVWGDPAIRLPVQWPLILRVGRRPA
jgi:SAM-dependent methyltransferase